MDAQRALLDGLMGAGRNLTDEERRGFKEIEWYDRKVCAYYLVRFCPHDLFFNTRSDLGECSRIHDPKLKESFEKSSKHNSYVPIFEDELVEFCEKLVNDLDDKFKLIQERLAQDIQLLEEEIKSVLEQAEAHGEEGKVDEAEALMKKVEELNNEKTVLLQRTNDNVPTLCEVCGTFLVSKDTAERTRYHVTGKQHVGYGMVRDFLAEQKAAKGKGKEADDNRKPREKETEINRSGGYRDRDRDRDGDRHRDRGRDHIKPYDNKPWRRRSRSRSPHRRVSRS